MLLLDVGNTYTKWEASISNSCIHGSFYTKELIQQLTKLLDVYPNICVVAASWVGKKETKPDIEQMLMERGIQFVEARSESEWGGLKNGYYDCAKLGVDRWLAMLGLWRRERKAFCVVDAGTALTFDFVRSDGQHLGGYIVPGVRTMIGSLNSATALIDCSLSAGDMIMVPGRNTHEAVQRGVVLSLVGAIDCILGKVSADLCIKEIDCFIGGGDAELLQPLLGSKWQLEEFLVLSGLKAYLHKTN